jgi:hypothetical protein
MKNVMKKMPKIFAQIGLGVMILLGFASTAYALPDYTVLTPVPGVTSCEGNTDNPSANCTTNLETYLPGVFKLSIGIAAIMAFVMITFGGIMYATSDAITGKSAGRQYVEDAIWGLLLVIGAWALLNTINPDILKFQLSVPDIVFGNNTAPAVTVAPNSSAAVKVGKVLQGYVLSADEVKQNDDIRKTLANNTPPVLVNNASCATGATQGCTNVVFLPDSAINGVENLAKACENSNNGALCGIKITGGTEGGHSDHGPGIPVVDLSPTTELNNYLAKTNKAAAAPVSGTCVVVNGASYTYENTGDNGRATAPHWHTNYGSNASCKNG